MNVLKKLSKLSNDLTELRDEMDIILEGITNTDLYIEFETRVRDEVENALLNLDIAITDIEDGMYAEDDIDDKDDEDYSSDW